MKRLLPVLLLLLLGACSEKVEVNIYGGSWDGVEGRYAAYGVDTVWVMCKPFRDISYVELRIDGVLVGVDTFPGPESRFEWDVRQLPEASVHILQARAISGSREYLSREDSVWVGFRSRIIVDGRGDTFCIYLPDGKTEGCFYLTEDASLSCPRLGPGCHSVVFIADHRLYGRSRSESGPAELLAQVTNGIYSCDASPVSSLVAFEGYPAGTAHIFTVDSFGNKSQLTHDSDFVIIDSSRFTCVENSSPVFSPDGTKLAYFRKSKCLVPGDPHHDETRKDAFVMNSNGSNPVNLTAGVDDADFSSFTWTFDGKWVLFRVGTGHNAHGVCAVNMSGHAITGQLVPSAAVACSPVDSTLIYVDPDFGREMFWKKLGWTNDTIYADTAGLPFGEGARTYSDHIDWVRYSKQ
jgi:hypothetical protein